MLSLIFRIIILECVIAFNKNLDNVCTKIYSVTFCLFKLTSLFSWVIINSLGNLLLEGVHIMASLHLHYCEYLNSSAITLIVYILFTWNVLLQWFLECTATKRFFIEKEKYCLSKPYNPFWNHMLYVT